MYKYTYAYNHIFILRFLHTKNICDDPTCLVQMKALYDILGFVLTLVKVLWLRYHATSFKF